MLAPLALAVWIGVWRNTPTRAARMAVVLAMACLAFGVVATTLLTGGLAIFGGLLLAALVPLVAIRPRWAAGTPNAVFEATPADLLDLTGGTTLDVRKG